MRGLGGGSFGSGSFGSGSFAGGSFGSASFGSGSFDPNTLAIIETAFDEAWLALKCDGNHKVRAHELARCVLRLAMEGERDVSRLHERALATLAPAMTWREMTWRETNMDEAGKVANV